MPIYDFVDGESLSAAMLNTYLSKQVVMTFASASARTSALASVLSEGMVTYLEDTKQVQMYDGSMWQPLTIRQNLAHVRDTSVNWTSASSVSVLSIPLEPDVAYLIEAVVFCVSQNSGDTHPSFTWTRPAGTTGYWYMDNDSGSNNDLVRSPAGSITTTPAIIPAGLVGTYGTTYTLSGLFKTSTTPGSLSLAVQGTSGAAGTVTDGSHLLGRAA